MEDVRSPIPMRGLSWELMCVLLRMRVMCSEIAGNGKHKYGTLLMNTEEKIDRWAEYDRYLLNRTREHIDGRDEPLTEDPLHEVTCEEVERQLNKMKNGKSCGPDEIPTEA